MHHDDAAFDSFDAIKSRVKTALADPRVHCVLMSVDGPGGLLAGCFDTVTEVVNAGLEANKPIYTYVDSQACSANYALALCGSIIWVPTTGLVGSIGVIEGMPDISGQDQMMGVSYRWVTSGERKKDTNPHIPFAEREAGIAVQDAQAKHAGELFFELVATRRPVNVDALRAMNGAIFIGQEAISVGLADRLGTLDSVVAELAASAGQVTGYKAPNEGRPMAKMSDALKALQAVADESKDEKEVAQARAILAAHYGNGATAAADEPPPAEEKKDEPPPAEEKKEEARAEAPAHEEPDADDKGKQAIAAAKVATDAARSALLATRPDFSREQLATLSAAPISIVQDAVKSWPKAQAAVTVAGALAATSAKSSVARAPAGALRAESDTSPGDMSELEVKLLAQLNPTIPEGGYENEDGAWAVITCTPATQKKMLADRTAARRVS
jgi:ClpP class serine protease